MNNKSFQNLSVEMFLPLTSLSSSPTSCTCCAPSSSTSPAPEGSDPPFLIKTSEFSIKLKEIIILGLIFLLLLYSILTFLSKWSKSYRQINQIPYYSTHQEEQLSPGKKEVSVSNNSLYLSPSLGGGGPEYQQNRQQNVQDSSGEN